MAFHYHAHGRPQVIQGNFQGRLPAFTVQARPAFPQAAQRQRAPHVQAALQQHASQRHTAQRHSGPQPPTAQPARFGNAFQVPSTINLSHPGQGRPLPDAVRQQMESFFNTDFSDVRVHVGAQAQSIGAVAFTMGSQIHFAPGQYNPNTSHGQRLLGHELTHVMQQRAGRVRNPFGGGVAVVQDPGMEAEADQMGIQAAAHRAPVQAKGANSFDRTVARRGENPAHAFHSPTPIQRYVTWVETWEYPHESGGMGSVEVGSPATAEALRSILQDNTEDPRVMRLLTTKGLQNQLRAICEDDKIEWLQIRKGDSPEQLIALMEQQLGLQPLPKKKSESAPDIHDILGIAGKIVEEINRGSYKVGGGTIMVMEWSGTHYFSCSGNPSGSKTTYLERIAESKGLTVRQGTSAAAGEEIIKRGISNANVRSNVNEVCAEVKMLDITESKPRKAVVVWVGEDKNPYPAVLTETGRGSQMLPCPACRVMYSGK